MGRSEGGSDSSSVSQLIGAVKRAFAKRDKGDDDDDDELCDSSRGQLFPSSAAGPCADSSETLEVPSPASDQLLTQRLETLRDDPITKSLAGVSGERSLPRAGPARRSSAAMIESIPMSPCSPLRRVSQDLAEPVSPTSLHVVKQMRQRANMACNSQAAASSGRSKYRSSDPGCGMGDNANQQQFMFASGSAFSFCPAILENGDDSNLCELCQGDPLPSSPSHSDWRRTSITRGALFGSDSPRPSGVSTWTPPEIGTASNVSSECDGPSSVRPSHHSWSTPASPDKPSVCRQYCRTLSETGSNHPVDRRAYMTSQKFRQRRLTDSDAVMNLREVCAVPDQDLEILARQMGLSINCSSFSAPPPLDLNSPGTSPPVISSGLAMSAKHSHPAVKLRRLRSSNSHFQDEPRPLMPIRPVYNLPSPGSSDRSLRKLRSFPVTSEQPNSPCSVLSRSISSTGRCSDSGDSFLSSGRSFRGSSFDSSDCSFTHAVTATKLPLGAL